MVVRTPCCGRRGAGELSKRGGEESGHQRAWGVRASLEEVLPN